MDIKDVEITIGSDPEFAILCGDSIENALEILSILLEEQYNCTEYHEDDLISYFCTTDIGCDGSRIIGELRPAFSVDPVEHFKNITILIKKLYNRIYKTNVCKSNEKVSIVSGGYVNNRPLGGHIHIGFKSNKYWLYNFLKNGLTYNSIPTVDLSIDKIFSYVLSFYSGIPLFLTENIEQAIERRKKYGKFGEYREKEDYGIEWRMLSSWIVSPEIAISTLVLSYVIADEIYNTIINNLKDLENNVRIELKNKYASNIENIIINEIKCAQKRYKDYDYSINLDKNINDLELNSLSNIISDNVFNYLYLGDYIREFMLNFYDVTDIKYHRLTNKIIINDISRRIYSSFDDITEKVVSDILTRGSVINYLYSDQYVYNIVKEFNENVENLNRIVEENIRQELLYNFVSYLRYLVKDIIYPHVKQFRLYNKYKEYIDMIFNMIKHRETWTTDDIMPRWKQLWT